MRAGCYLLLGEDDWSKKQYIDKVKAEVLTPGGEMMNYYEAKEKDVLVSALEDFCETLPFFAEQKLVLIKDTGLFKTGRKDESERLEQFLEKLPDYVVLLIDEKDADKRGKLFKTIKAQHEIVAFSYPGEEVVVKLLLERANAEGYRIDQGTLYYLVRNMPEDISYILGEWEKLTAFVSDQSITKEAVDQICVFSLETRVFELVKKIAAGKSDEALEIYNRMLQSKESPIGILVLIARQFRMMYQVKYLKAKGQDQKQIAAQTKMPYFAVKEMLDQVTRYRFEMLETLIAECLETDRAMKTGKMDPARGVEILILRALNHK